MKIIKKYAILLLGLFILISNAGCSNKSVAGEKYQEWEKNQLVYEYEDVEAIITKIDMRHWFAITHKYEWNMEVYYEPYDLKFNENSWANGAMNCPSFLDKKV